jgi:hypothetical protein
MLKLIACSYASSPLHLDLAVTKDKEKMPHKIEGFFLLLLFGYEGMYYSTIGIY